MSGSTGYADIAAHYRRLIADGTLVPGDPMPSIRNVRDEFDVTITTANRAFAVLKAEGLTAPKAGVGTVVADRPFFGSTGAARLDRLERTGRPLGVKEKSIKHTAALVPCADPAICRALEIEPHDEVVRRTRVYTHDDTPNIFSMACIHPRALEAVPEILRPGTTGPFWQHLYTERTGHTITKSPEMQGARPANAHELAQLEVGLDQLGLPEGATVPVLVLVNVFHDEDGPIEVWEDVFGPGRWRVEGQ